jgi:putative hydrolase of the HAD superfamily
MTDNKFPFKAVLVDLFDTTIYCPWSTLRREMAMTSGVPVDDFLAALALTQAGRNVGAYGSEQHDLEEISRAGKLGLDRAHISSLVKFERAYLERHGNYYPDVGGFLKSAKRAGLKSGVISNCSYGAATLIGRLDVRKLFDHVFLSFEVGYRKPDPEIYHLALSALEMDPSEVLFIDDQLRFCAGAASAGMSVMLIKRSIADHANAVHNFPYVSHLDISSLTRKELFIPPGRWCELQS